MDYQEFLNSKTLPIKNYGINIKRKDLNLKMFEFEKDITWWSLRKGKAAIFASPGLGKTFMQMEFLKCLNFIVNKSLIVAPLNVAKQTKQEGIKFGYKINIAESQDDIKRGINITNYEKLHKFNLSKMGAICLDESSILKSQTGKWRSWLIENTKNIEYKLCCTATPAPNDFMELGNHAEFLGYMTVGEMKAIFFINDQTQTQKWRLKRHCIDKFWEWVASWAAIIHEPSDLGYKNDGFDLPELKIINHIIESKEIMPGCLFPKMAETLTERRLARRKAISDKAKKTLEIINNYDGYLNKPLLIWVDLNAEQDYLEKIFVNAFSLRGLQGSQSEKIREAQIYGWLNKEKLIMISKPSILGFGLNFQLCSNVIFFGLSDSFERYYQAVRRCWRFGQTNNVTAHILTSSIEGNVLQNIKRKEKNALEMRKYMIKHTKKYVMENIKGKDKKKSNYSPKNQIHLPVWLKGDKNGIKY
jgi:hypothetical protein